MRLNNLYLVIFGMAIVTYIPRMIPMNLLSDINLSPFWKRVLTLIPYTVLSALIFPEILFSTGNVKSAIFGGVLSGILAYFNLNLFLIVISGILGVLGWQIFF
jgi:branched-subunit amino acid transport protein